MANCSLSRDELAAEHVEVLPPRDLFLTISILGLPLIGIGDLAINIDTSGPNWLFGSVGSI